MNVVITEKENLLSDAERSIIECIASWFDSFGPGNNQFNIGDDVSDDACNEILDCISTST